MATYYCEPCRNKGRIVKAVTRVITTPMCARHSDQEPRSALRTQLQDAPIVPHPIATAAKVAMQFEGEKLLVQPGADGELTEVAKLQPSPEPKVKLPEKVGEVLVVSMDDVPLRRTPKGVAEELMQQLQGLAVGKAAATRCQSAKLAETTVKNVRVHAKKRGIKIGATIKDGIAYMWVTEKTEVAR